LRCAPECSGRAKIAAKERCQRSLNAEWNGSRTRKIRSAFRVKRIYPHLVEIFGIDGKRRWKEQQRQKKEMDNAHVNQPGLEARTLALKGRSVGIGIEIE
jgi:hypothetical protein